MPAVNSTPPVAFEGVLYHLPPADAADTPWQLQPVDWVLQPDLDLVKALPGWAAAVQQQQARQQLPQEPLLLQSVANVYSAAALQAAVRQNPAPWRDGTGQWIATVGVVAFVCPGGGCQPPAVNCTQQGSLSCACACVASS